MLRNVRGSLPITTLILLICSGCASTARVRPAAPQGPPAARESAAARVVELKKLVIRVPASRAVGVLQSGWGCVSRKPLAPATGRAFLTDGDLEEVFRAEFTSAGYTVAGDPNALFEETSENRPDYLIGGIVHDVQANLCSPGLRFGATDRAKGEASLAVDWQVYSLRTRKVEFSVTSDGAGRLESPRDGGGFEVFRQAFRAAARTLLANPRLREVLEGQALAAQEQTAEAEPIVVAFETRSREKKTAIPEVMLSDARLSVVTISAGDAFGSGFLISSDGYLLTNQHVVGNARYVTARFVTGREVNGEVIRSSAFRDVALVKLENDRYRPLPLRDTSVLKAGADVFAIGTPLSEDFGQTVSKGIVSGFGEEDGVRMIRSDVGIHKGSSGGPLLTKSGEVVGIAVGGVILLPTGVGVGLNSFIPIEEAIEVLGLRNREGAHGLSLEQVVSREKTGN
jgi:serine protease Do